MSDHTYADFGIEIPFGGSGEVRVQCPQCTPMRKPQNQRKRELAVNTVEGVWHCHHCGWKGSLKAGADASTTYTGSHDVPVAERKEYRAPRPLPSVTAPTLWDNAVNWFKGRGIPEAVMVEKGITASNEYCPVCQKETGHVLYPFFVNGEHINTKHRCGKKHFRMEAGAQRVLYNLDACQGADHLVIVEGEMDALACHTAGVTSVVSVPDGAPAISAGSYSSKFTFLESAEDLFASVKSVTLATDADAPGQKLLDELSRRIGPEKCKRVIWPEGIKDANECLLRDGPDYLRMCIELAEPFPVEGIYTGRDLEPDLIKLYDNGEDNGLTFGVPALDEVYRIMPGRMSIVTGIPSHGKSTALDQMLMWLAARHDWTFAIFSPEQQPLVRHQQVLIEQYVGKPFTRGPSARMSKDEMLAANAWVADRFAFLLPETTEVDTILELARVQVFRNGVRGVVIDPWNELEHSRPRHQSETEYISDALTKFRRFARHHDVHLWIVAHPTKMRRSEDGTEPKPGLWDISGSAHFRNKADVGITIWRDLEADNNTVELHTTKVRFPDSGKLGSVRFGYEPSSKRFYSLGKVES